MPKPKKGARLGGSASHQKHILSNLAAQLFTHHVIKTTDTKAKLLRPYAEKLITKAKSGTVADRRNVLKLVNNREVVDYLFNELAPKFEGRAGGYTRIVKLGNRKGDNAPISQISLVLEAVNAKSADDSRAARAEASKKAEDKAAKEAEETKVEAEAPEVEADEATDAEAETEAKEAEAEEAEEK